MTFKKKALDENLTKVELCVEVTANNNNIGNCPTNNNVSGCGC